MASFPDYLRAQALVDQMSDDGFPVEHVRIVGDGVRTVEQVTGRMTLAKGALAGAATGAWFGLLIRAAAGSVRERAGGLGIDPVGQLGARRGVGRDLRRPGPLGNPGERDFSSVMTLKAERYDVYVDAAHSAQASRYRTE